MASFLPAWYFSQTLRGKFFQTVILLVLSLLLINWYFFGEGRMWSNNGPLEKIENHMRAAVDKDIRILERISLYKFPNNSRNNETFQDVAKKYFSTKVKSSSVVTRSEGDSNNIKPTEEDPTTESFRRCPNLSLQSTNNAEYGLCTPHQPSEYSCDFTREMFFIRPELSKCKKKGMGDVCLMKANKTSEGSAINFVCNKELCKQGESDSFKVHSVNPRTGLTETVKEFSTVEKLEKGLPAIARRNKENKFNFIFIDCTSHQGKRVSHLIPLEPRFTIKETKKIRDRNLINVNVLLIDSLSRAHFYRSLPRTVSTFKKWRENPRAVPAKVFDFELFQAVHGHTAVNMHAFYTGEIFPVEQKDKTLPLNISALFGQYKRAGYHTVWQEDLCWRGVWGLMTDLGASGWDGLQAEMKSAYIDHTGACIVIY